MDLMDIMGLTAIAVLVGSTVPLVLTVSMVHLAITALTTNNAVDRSTITTVLHTHAVHLLPDHPQEVLSTATTADPQVTAEDVDAAASAAAAAVASEDPQATAPVHSEAAHPTAEAPSPST